VEILGFDVPLALATERSELAEDAPDGGETERSGEVDERGCNCGEEFDGVAGGDVREFDC